MADIDDIPSHPRRGRPPKAIAGADDARKPVRLLVDYWPADPEAQDHADPLGKVKAGTVLDLEIGEARTAIAKGQAERADPF